MQVLAFILWRKILTIGTAKVWHWTLARSYFWRSLSEIDNDFRRILSIWRNLSFTCCLFEVVLDTVLLVWNSLSFGPSLAPFRPGKWSAILSQSDKKSYTFRNVYITHLRDLKMGAGETHDFSCFYHISTCSTVIYIQIRHQWSERSGARLRGYYLRLLGLL